MWLGIAVFSLYILILTTQRTALIYPLIVFVVAWFFQTKVRTIIAYVSGVSLLILGVMFSTSLLNGGLESINKAIEVDSEWGSQVLKVSTFSDRLRGWERLKKVDTYSLFGTKSTTSGLEGSEMFNSDDYNHDLVNKILIHTGIVGLLALVIPLVFILFKLHKSCWNQPNVESVKWAAFALALVLPMIVMSMLGGGNFNTNPINLQIWSTFAGVFIMRAYAKEAINFQSEVSL